MFSVLISTDRFLTRILLLFSGISMHKGYAFVQFANPFDARSACLGEDNRTVLGQTLGKFLAVRFARHLKGVISFSVPP